MRRIARALTSAAIAGCLAAVVLVAVPGPAGAVLAARRGGVRRRHQRPADVEGPRPADPRSRAGGHGLHVERPDDRGGHDLPRSEPRRGNRRNRAGLAQGRGERRYGRHGELPVRRVRREPWPLQEPRGPRLQPRRRLRGARREQQDVHDPSVPGCKERSAAADAAAGPACDNSRSSASPNGASGHRGTGAAAHRGTGHSGTGAAAHRACSDRARSARARAHRATSERARCPRPLRRQPPPWRPRRPSRLTRQLPSRFEISWTTSSTPSRPSCTSACRNRQGGARLER